MPYIHPLPLPTPKEENKCQAIQEVDCSNIARDIVVGLFRLAGIEEDEDLLFACVSDVR